MYTGKRFLFLFGLYLISTSISAQIQLPELASDGMVLERDQELTIWGWASPGEEVSLTFINEEYSTSADEHGSWEIKLPHQNAGGPITERSMFRSNEVIIQFKNVGNGLSTPNGKPPQHFAISDDGEKFVWAKAEIIGNSLRVWNDEVLNPAAVRYAWANNPQSANLINKKGLPATPFEVTKN